MTLKVPLMPQWVKCPKCLQTWFRRTFNSEITTCSKCKATVIPIIMEDLPTKPLRLIQCGYCGGYQWYTGLKTKTTCMNPDCAKKNIIVRVVSPQELQDAINRAANKDEITEEERFFYDKIAEKYVEMMDKKNTALT